MAKVKRYKGDGEKVTSVWNDKGDKRYGFVSKDRRPSEQYPAPGRYATRYGVGIDNLPFGGSSDNELKTLLGTLDFGNDYDTGYAGFTPNLERTVAPEIGQDYLSSVLGDTLLQAGKYHGNTDNPSYFASAFLPGDKQYIPDIDLGVNTPVGRFGLESNYDSPNTLEANFTPQNYIQALAKLLSRGR